MDLSSLQPFDHTRVSGIATRVVRWPFNTRFTAAQERIHYRVYATRHRNTHSNMRCAEEVSLLAARGPSTTTTTTAEPPRGLANGGKKRGGEDTAI